MRVLITGGDGQLGMALRPLFGDADAMESPDVDRLDVTDEPSVRAFFDDFGPDLVIHAAAYTDVDGCESNRDLAYLVNETGARRVAEAAAARGARLIAVSTDFVFDGAKEAPYVEADETHPLSVYGGSKRAGEVAVLAAHPGAAVVRTAWLYGEGGTGNFVTAILGTAARGLSLRVVDDQAGSPTYAADLAAAIVALSRTKEVGIFHAVNAGAASRLEFARAILDLSGRKRTPIEAIKSDGLSRPARRPARSVLGGSRLAAAGVPALRPWKEALAEYLDRIGERREDHV